MTNEEIIKHGPEDWTHHDSTYYYKLDGYEKLRWDRSAYIIHGIYDKANIRSRTDIERIVELEIMVYNGNWDE